MNKVPHIQIGQQNLFFLISPISFRSFNVFHSLENEIQTSYNVLCDVQLSSYASALYSCCRHTARVSSHRAFTTPCSLSEPVPQWLLSIPVPQLKCQRGQRQSSFLHSLSFCIQFSFLYITYDYLKLVFLSFLFSVFPLATTRIQIWGTHMPYLLY